MTNRAADDRILPETRWASVAIAIILLVAFALLFFWPDDTDRMFAWTIRPRMTPLLMGTGYLAGSYVFIRMIFETRWHRAGQGFLPVAAFSVFMVLATLLHWDRFNHGHITFSMWVVVYVATSLLMPVLYLRNRAADPGTPEADDVLVPRAVGWIFGAMGAIMAAVALFLFLLPEAAISVWPWQLTPLTSRVIAGWYTLPAGIGIIALLERRWSALRYLVQASVMWMLLLLVAIARAWGDFDQANPLTWVYIGSIVGTLAGMAALYVAMEARRRAPGATLRHEAAAH